ncbi:MAG: hypothetical protein JWL84_3061 [Rhodospirillales bacterium]|jgi:hypothetical protein|nr:hypothetical protein [Rhodospirillales bacterium]
MVTVHGTMSHQQGMRRRLAILILLMAGGLGACASPDTDAGVGAQPTPPVTAAPPHRPTTTAALPRPVRKPTPPGEKIDPNRIIGLNESGAEGWLGQPTERKDAPPATIWRYVRPDCEVDVYFYLDLQQRIMRALHYEVRGNDGEQRSDRCVEQLVSERHEGDGGAVADPPR